MLARLFRDLDAFQPTVVGTYPLGLQVDGSDLDIACTCNDLDAFERALRAALADLGIAEVRVERTEDVEPPAIVAVFELGDLAIEVFGQPLPVHEQRGFRHMVIEGQLLVCGGPSLREQVRALKRSGLKTEPAFARLLSLAGDPYAGLLELEAWPPERLRSIVRRVLDPAVPPGIGPYTGVRAALLPLFRTADDSEREIAGYLPRGTILVARDGDALVGHVQMIEDAHDRTWELKSLAVVDAHRNRGLGRRLVEAGVGHARGHGAARVLVSTGAADTQLLRFYQRLGFRMLRLERDVFTPARGYPPDLAVDGIPLRDRMWLDRIW
jgi:ribosomal protein S18 acetylase RimI-like enzyme